jgi:hypothetical protein
MVWSPGPFGSMSDKRDSVALHVSRKTSARPPPCQHRNADPSRRSSRQRRREPRPAAGARGRARVRLKVDVMVVGASSAAWKAREATAAGQAPGVRVDAVAFRNHEELDRVFAATARGSRAVLLPLPSGPMFGERQGLAELAVKHRLPTVNDAREYVEAGGLVAYGPNRLDLFRRAAADGGRCAVVGRVSRYCRGGRGECGRPGPVLRSAGPSGTACTSRSRRSSPSSTPELGPWPAGDRRRGSPWDRAR